LQAAASTGFCFGCSFDSEWLAYFSWFSQMSIRILLLASFFSDILLILNRYFEIVQTPTFLSRLSKKLNLLICFGISLIVFSPAFFAVHVFKIPLQETFKAAWNVFGVSEYFKNFLFVVFLFEAVIPLLIFLCMSVVSNFKFKRLMQRHARLTGNQTEANIAEARFTKMVLIFASITLLTRSGELIATVFARFIWALILRLTKRNGVIQELF